MASGGFIRGARTGLRSGLSSHELASGQVSMLLRLLRASVVLTMLVGCGSGATLSFAKPSAQQVSPVAPVASVPPTYPLRVSANGRYLVDQGNAPFLIVGDSPQALIGGLSEQDADLFLADRQRFGFNSMWVNLLCNDYTGCRPDGSTFDGIPPFTTAGDLSTPNDAYFSRADRVIGLAGKYGMNVLLDPIETGGWMKILRGNSKDKAYNYGLYLGKRYKDVPNITWMSGNDFQSWRDTSDDALVLAVAQGIRDADPTHLQTLELDFQVSSSLDDQTWDGMVQLDAAYTYYPTYAEVLKEYNRTNFKPIFMVEANYEFEHEYTGPATLRRQEYWALLSGAAGQLYGNKYSWQFAADWKNNIDTVGALQMQYATNCFAVRHWYDLIPDQQHTFMTAGFGTFADSGSVNSNDYATAALAADGTLAIAYVPTERSITVDLSKLAGPAQARWFDPSNATYIAVGDGSLANAGSRELRTPGKNAAGDADWLLVLETTR
jgi:hypothetical protein